MFRINLSRSMFVYPAMFLLGVLLVPVLGGLFSGTLPAGVLAAQAQSGDPQAVPATLLGPDAPDFVLFTCNPDFVGELDNRVHVHCMTPATGGIYWFATPTSDSKRAARIFSLMLTAAAASKNVRIYYETNASGASFGCSFSDCRPILYIELIK